MLSYYEKIDCGEFGNNRNHLHTILFNKFPESFNMPKYSVYLINDAESIFCRAAGAICYQNYLHHTTRGGDRTKTRLSAKSVRIHNKP